MSQKCKDFYENGSPCRFKAKNDGFCKIHHPNKQNNNKKEKTIKNSKTNIKQLLKGVTILGVLAILASINGTWNLFEKVGNLWQKNYEPVICNRDLDSGCQIDLPDILNWRVGFGGLEAIQLTYQIGEKKRTITLEYLDKNSPLVPQKKLNTKESFPTELSPYNVLIGSNILFFDGDIKEFKDNEFIGWFNQNDFGTTNCGIRWNKDEKGLEILDKYGYVVFSLDYIKEIELIKFKGYFRKGKIIYIYGDKSYSTTNIEYAEELISKIKPIFKHRGLNSTGVRL